MDIRCLARSLAVAAMLNGLATGGAQASSPAEGKTGYHSDVTTTQVVSAFVGANVYIPATIVIVGGREHTLSIFNATDQPHGFAIDGLGIEVTLEAKQTTEVKLPALEGGAVYRIHCQLHAAHRSGTLVVLPGE